jgi:hypothetical protein
MIERILRAFVWGCVGTIIGFLAVGIIAIRINTIRYGYDPSIDIDGASEIISYAIGCPLGFTFGAIYGFRERRGAHVTRKYKPPYGYMKRSYEVAIVLSLTICGGIAGYLFLGGTNRVVGGLVGWACGNSFARSLFWVHYYFVEGKKRPWQFDLRTVFFVMTLAAVLLGIIAVLLHEKS